ncbi:RNA-directed DNA polymerase [Hujiaoplasma nucleasis]|uniref:RNA-directed DNA polymerase n=1 Tax=Hujiaoplasma nucleasis TaxID=2725268 RepID=A0A7L6N5I8_9MOLU|nr:reverse transcriptase family protein [Hujiaoplasma nucleasis]QLY39839.1 RNA-directed DNA polymerase [Hujiaoplasma nucleasis]
MENALFNLKSKKKLAKLLFYDKIGYLDKDLSFINNYSVFIVETSNGGTIKSRIVETPRGMLKVIHDRVFKFLNQVDLPDYLISKRGSSYVQNHISHKNNSNVVSIDIQKFYPMCSFGNVYKFFHNTMNMSPDVAYIISEILTINYENIKINDKVDEYLEQQEVKNKVKFPTKHIPTGSSVSNILSFLSYREMFEEIAQLSKRYNIEMTVYVDDITFSSNEQFPKTFIGKVKKILIKNGHKYNKRKSKKLDKNHNKNITGVIVNKYKQTKIPNKLHLKYKYAKRDLLKDPSQLNNQKLNGIKEAMKQIDTVSKK